MHALTSIILLLVPLIGSWIVSKNAKMDKKWYKSLKKSKYTPPDSTFQMIWPVLYVFLGINASLLYLNLGKEFWEKYYLLYLIQLGLNYLWTFAFFKSKNPPLALLLLLFMVLITAMLTLISLKVSEVAFILIFAYLLWLLFAFVLNLYIVMNNKA